MRQLFMVLGLCALTLASPAQDWFKVKTSGVNPREIGPALTSGRIADLAIDPNNTDRWFIAVASGGVWKTENHGTTFEPLFDKQGSYSIGCVSLDPNNSNVVWVGTGENNGQRSVAYGDGVYKSEDGGKSWKNMGLKSSEHIAKIWINPSNSNEVWVAAQGPLWSSGGERGLFKTTDGGATWKAVLEVDRHTGISDLVVDPRLNGVMYASAWQRQRKVWTFISGGPSSALYISKDWGNTWSKAANGFPGGELGRIGLAISPVNPDRVFAVVEAGKGKKGVYRTDNRGASWTKKSATSTSGNYYQEIYCDPTNEDIVYIMDTYGLISYNGGAEFERIKEKNKHVDNHALWVNPNNRMHWIMGCDGGVYETYDEGAQWNFKANLPVVQFYKIAVDNKKPFYSVYGGTQDNYSLGGASQTRSSNGIRNSDWFVTNGGDGFQSVVDPTNPDIVYSQAQYGWLVRYNRKTGERIGIQPQNTDSLPAFRWNWDAPLIISPHNSSTLYFCANHVFKSEDKGNSWTIVSPDLSRQTDRSQLKVMDRYWADGTIAWNKSTSDYGNITAFAESAKQQGLIYAGTDDGLLHISHNDGKTWRKISRFSGVPEYTYIADVYCSESNADEVFVVPNNHKQGDFKPYILRSINQGESWTSVTGDLPARGSVYSFVADGDTWFCGTEFGAYYSLDKGAHWKKVDGLPTIAVRDIALQKEEKDAVFGTFGRGMWVMDDYSLLAKTKSLKEGLIPTSIPFPWYVQSAELGRSGKAFQGASLYAAENPKPGVTFNYFLESLPESPKKKREKGYSKDGASPMAYPTEAELLAEKNYSAPKIKIEIVDADGNYVHHIWAKAASGLNRLHWNFRTGSNKPPKGLKLPKGVEDWGRLVLPGNYKAQMYVLSGGELQRKGEQIAFEVVSIDGHTPSDLKEIEAFRKEVQEVIDRVADAKEALKEARKELKQVNARLYHQKVWNQNAFNAAQKQELELQELEKRMNGNKLLEERYFTVKPGLSSMAGTLNYNCFMTTGTVTQTMRDLSADLTRKVARFEADLSELRESISGE